MENLVNQKNDVSDWAIYNSKPCIRCMVKDRHTNTLKVRCDACSFQQPLQVFGHGGIMIPLSIHLHCYFKTLTKFCK